jgi:hypothetical protein
MVSIAFSSIGLITCRIIENVFRVLVVKFGAFEACVNLRLVNSDVVMACCVLLNFFVWWMWPQLRIHITWLLGQEDTAAGIITLGLQASPANMVDLQKGCDRNATEKAKIAREKFRTYFKNKGPSFMATHLFAMHIIRMSLSCVSDF